MSKTTASRVPRSRSRRQKCRNDDENLTGIVSYVDEKYALVNAMRPDLETIDVGLTDLSTLRRSTGFGDLVERVDEFVSVSDDVIVDLKSGSDDYGERPVSCIRTCPSPRPDLYGRLRDYLQKKPPVKWPRVSHSHVPNRRSGEAVVVMACALRGWNKIPAHHFLSIVEKFHADEDIGSVFQSYIKTWKALMSFVRSVPQYFFIDHQVRVCTYEGFTRKEFEAVIATRCSEIPKKARKYGPKDARLISTVEESLEALEPLLRESSLDRPGENRREGQQPGLVVALGSEGVNLGRGGQLTLVQLCTVEGRVFFFDVLREPRIFREGRLAHLLQSDAVLKVMHDCGNTAAALYHEFGITLKNVFDTSVAYGVLQEQCMVADKRSNVNFDIICRIAGEKAVRKTKEFKKKNTKHVWAKRPISDEMLNYAASDVILLVPNIYKALDRLIHPNWKMLCRLRCEHGIRERTEGTSPREHTKNASSRESERKHSTLRENYNNSSIMRELVTANRSISLRENCKSAPIRELVTTDITLRDNNSTSSIREL